MVQHKSLEYFSLSLPLSFGTFIVDSESIFHYNTIATYQTHNFEIIIIHVFFLMTSTSSAHFTSSPLTFSHSLTHTHFFARIGVQLNAYNGSISTAAIYSSCRFFCVSDIFLISIQLMRI